MFHISSRAILVAAALAFADSSAALAQHPGDIWVGITSGNQLTRGGFDIREITILSPTDGGWIDSDPGFDHVVNAQPNLLPLQAGCDIWLELVDPAPALLTIQVGTFATLRNPGDRFRLRPTGPAIHEHPFWFIDSTDPGFAPSWRVWRATFRLVDLGGTGYSPSEPFELLFAPEQPLVGDMNCDGIITPGDIAGFVLALTNPSAYADAFPGCHESLADINDDGIVSPGDIAGFVSLLTGS